MLIFPRDSCRCSKCVNQDTMQRTFSIFDLPDSCDLAALRIMVETNGFRVICELMAPSQKHSATCTDPKQGKYENHESFYDWNFIERYLHRTNVLNSKSAPPQRQLWGSDIAKDPPTVQYEDVMNSTSEGGMAKLTDHLVSQYMLSLLGLVLICTVPDAIRSCVRGWHSVR